MRRIFSGKSYRDTEFAVDSLINPTLIGNLPKKSNKLSSRLTVTEQQQVSKQIDDLGEKKIH
jgi:hypothetical protein